MKTPLILTVLTWTLISFAIFEGTSASPIPAVGESDFPAGCSCGSSTTTSGTPKSAAASIVGGGTYLYLLIVHIIFKDGKNFTHAQAK